MSDQAISNEFLRDACETVRSTARVHPQGAKTKPSLYARQDSLAIDMTSLSGILQYDPGEFTITVNSGTTLTEIRDALSSEGQYLPFDPPLADSGATIGGTVAAGMSGSNRVLYGGVRDFILGVQFVDGHGNLHRGGGKVVKNAAGFDLPKFFVGSLGRYGILTELCFKVFPEPQNYRTLIFEMESVEVAVEKMCSLGKSGLQFTAVDLESVLGAPTSNLVIRVCGSDEAMDKHAARISQSVGSERVSLSGSPERNYWAAVGEFSNDEKPRASDLLLIKVPLTTSRIPELNAALKDLEISVRYAAMGNVAWLFGTSDQSEAVDIALNRLQLSGLVVLGETAKTTLGIGIANGFASRIKTALDPESKFGPLT